MQGKSKHTNFRFERLEPRLLLSADPISGGLALLAPDAPEDNEIVSNIVPFKDADAARDANSDHLELDDVTAIFAYPEPATREVVFVNADVQDYNTLIQNMDESVEVVIIESGEDGMQRISEYLDSGAPVSAIHIVSHGNTDGFWLGNTFVDNNLLASQQEQLQSWGENLTEDADVLIYGCNLAANDNGVALLKDFAALTGADVAASDDLTGAESLGGDWDLEFTIGDIESTDLAGFLAQRNWQGTLDAITVTTTADVLDGDADTASISALLANPGSDGLVSLREALTAANNGAGADTIFLAAGTYRITTLNLVDSGGDFDIRDDVSIVGDSPTTTILDGDLNSSVLDVHDDSAITVTLANLKIQNGITSTLAGSDGAGLRIQGGGTQPDVYLSNVWFFNNDTNGSGDEGGAIYNAGILSISNSLFENNTSDSGGAIYNTASATLAVSNSTFSNNTATAGSGGALNNQGVATLTNVTITGNSATADGGGIHTDGAGTTTIANSIVSGNTASVNGPDINGTISSLGSNIIGDDSDASGFVGSDQLNVDPLLGLLMDNGGELKTHAPGVGSLAINGGDVALAPAIDQLGLLRDTQADIGAFEVGATSPPEQGTIWFTTDKAVSGGGQSGLDTWDQADVMTFDDPLLNLGAGTTSGTVGNILNFGPAVPAISGMHFVSQDVSIAGGAFELLAGDVLINPEDNAAVFTSNNAVPLASGFAASVNADRRDIVIFRPDTPGDYSQGQWAFLIDDPDGGDIRAISLVETATEVGGSSLNAGDFLFVRNGGSEDQDIKWFSPTTIGDGTTSGTVVRLLDGDDANVGITEQIHGIELVEQPLTLGGVHLESGQILVTLHNGDTVGNNNLVVTEHDVFVLDVAQSTAAAGSGNGEASASRFFTGQHAAFDTNDERFNSFAIQSASTAPVADASAGAPYTITAGNSASFDGSNSSDPDGSISTYEWDLNNDGSFEKSGVTTSFSWAELNAAGITTNGSYDVGLRVTDNDGKTGSTVVSLTVSNAAPTLTNFVGPVDTTAEESEVEITFAELATQGDEADPGGTVNAFVVDSVLSGSLRIGADSASATAFAAGTNDVITAGLNAYWIPATDQSGTLDAFSVEARDNNGVLSGTPVDAQIAVTPVNDAPTLTAATFNIGTIDEDTVSNGFNVAAILSNYTTNDADGDTIGLALVNITGNSTWQFSADSTDGVDGTWQNVPVVSQNAALLLDENAWLRYSPDTVAGETVNLVFRAWDKTSGTASTTGSPSLADTTPPGGTSAFSVDNATAEVTVTDVNDIPTFTAFTSAIDATNEDTEVEITFTELTAQGDEADVDGTVDSFVVQAVSSGTLRIGADSASATAFAVGVNDVIGAGLNAYWTPASDQNGTLNAFTVEARDNDGALSGTPVTAQMTVNDINDIPTFTAFTNAIDTTNEDTEVEITFTELTAQGDESDVDGTVDSFVVQAISSGSLRIGADSASATAFAVGVNDVIGAGLNAYWTPASDQNGTLNAFTVEARDDDGGLSGTTVTAQMTVNDINDIPTFTAFTSAIDTTNEDTEVEVTFAELTAQGDEADVDGTVDSFVVQAVSSGSLRIGADSASATAFAVGVNDVIGAGLNAYWTPGADQNGTLNAFTVEARDDDGGLSGTPVTAQMTVNDINDIPTFTAFTSAIDTTNEDTEVEITFAELTTQGDEADVDGTVDSFVVQAVSSGTLRIGADSASATAFAVGVNDVIGAGLNAYWTPASDQNGTLNAFTVEARDDDGALSGTPVTAQMTVNDINDIPTFTAFTSAIDTTNEDTEVEVTFVELTAQGDEADVDGTVDSFVVQAVSSGTLRIGADSASATAFAVGVNDVIGAGLNAYWTPANDQNGTLNAFTVEARDDDGALSGTPVTAQMTVNDINDIPTFTAFTSAIDTTNEDTEVEITFAELTAQGDEADVDGTVDSFVVQAVSSGTLRIGADSASATAFAVGVNDVIGAGLNAYWTPASDENGTLNAFTLEARDNDGALSGTPVTAQITTTQLNDAPVIAATVLNPTATESGNTTGAVALIQGGSASLVDPDATNFNGGQITVTLDHYVTGDSLSVTGAHAGIASTTGGTGADLIINLNSSADASGVQNILESIRYTHNGDNPTLAGTDASRGFTIQLNDGGNAPAPGLDSNVLAGTITLVDENDAPDFTSVSGSVQSANTSVEESISFNDIHTLSDATDRDGSVDAYVVKTVLDGSLKIGSSAATASAWVAGVNDTIDSTNRAYWTSSPTASGTVNAFEIVALDNGGAESTPVITAQVDVFLTNQAPSLDQNTLSIAEGASVNIDTSYLSASDLDDPANALRFTVSAINNGQFELVSAPGIAVTDFTQEDINNGEIRFVHDGGELAPEYSITVSDGAISTPVSPATIIFTPVNDAPEITLNQLAINQDGSVTLSVGNNLNAVDPDNTPSELSFQVSKLSGGRFELSSAPGTAVTTFTAADLIAGNVKFIHNGGSAAPSYELRVADGTATSGPSSAKIDFTPSPQNSVFNNEQGAAEDYAKEQINQNKKSSNPADEDSTENNNGDEDAGDVTKNPELLAEKALSLRDENTTRDDQASDLGFRPAFDVPAETESDSERRNSASSTLKTLLTNQLRMAPELAAPVVSNIDASLELMSSVVRSTDFKQSLDVLRDDVSGELNLQQAQIGSSIAVSTGLSIGYVVWLIRGGVLVSSMLSALPAWRFIDPLPILAFGGSEEDEDQESLETLVQSNAKTTPSASKETGEIS